MIVISSSYGNEGKTLTLIHEQGVLRVSGIGSLLTGRQSAIINETIVVFMFAISVRCAMDFIHPVTAVIPGAQGKVLAVLAETTAELNLRTLARLADVSAAQASRVIPGLVDLGLVERREAPPSSLFRLNREHAAAQMVIDLARLRDTVLTQIGAAAQELQYPPASVVVFGSFARGQADRESDIDIVIVRPDEVDEDNEDWAEAIEQWRRTISSMTGNSVEIIEIDGATAIERLASGEQLWEEVARDGVVVHGTPLNELHILTHA